MHESVKNFRYISRLAKSVWWIKNDRKLKTVKTFYKQFGWIKFQSEVGTKYYIFLKIFSQTLPYVDRKDVCQDPPVLVS